MPSSRVPSTSEIQAEDPADRARAIANRAALKAAAAAGASALPPGPLAWLTILPELVAVWKIQAQMVADLAGAYGKTAYLTQGQMIYCLSDMLPQWRFATSSFVSVTATL